MSIYLSKLQAHMATDIEVKRLNVCSHARVMVIGVGMRWKNEFKINDKY